MAIWLEILSISAGMILVVSASVLHDEALQIPSFNIAGCPCNLRADDALLVLVNVPYNP
jgi:hypothetical protein